MYSLATCRFKLAEEFAEIRSVLRSGHHAYRLNTRLLDWTQRADRPLPVPFLDASIAGLLDTPFDNLIETPGVGIKKIATLLRVLRRVAGVTEPAPGVNKAAEPGTGSRQAAKLEELSAAFDAVCHTLRESRFDELRDKPLRHWVELGDRRLPTPCLLSTLDQVIATPFDRLCNLSTLGPKKLGMLIVLLQRAAGIETTASDPVQRTAISTDNDAAVISARSQPVDTTTSANLNEATWSKWRAQIAAQGLEREPLGRYARSLQHLSRSLWNARFAEFAGRSLAQLRSPTGLGEQRAREVLDVYSDLHALLAALGGRPQHLACPIMPRLAARLSAWCAWACQRDGLPTPAEIESELIVPLIEQLRTDLGDHAQRLAAWRQQRLAADAAPKHLAPQRGSSLSRINYLLHEARAVVEVRWPEGEVWLRRLWQKFHDHSASAQDRLAFDIAAELFCVSFSQDSTGTDAVPNGPPPQPWRNLAVGYRGPSTNPPTLRPAETRPRSRAAEPFDLAWIGKR